MAKTGWIPELLQDDCRELANWLDRKQCSFCLRRNKVPFPQKVIYRYELQFAAETIRMHEGAHIVYVGEQNGRLYIWAEVCLDMRLIDHNFIMIATGQVIPGLVARHLATVWHNHEMKHIYEITYDPNL